MEPVIFGVDFDGTVVTHDFPRMGRDIGAQYVLRKLVARGHKLILWTIRDKQYLRDAVNWFFQNDIHLFGVNKNPDQASWSGSPKAYCHQYIDDLALGAPLVIGDHERPYIDWARVERKLIRFGYL